LKNERGVGKYYNQNRMKSGYYLYGKFEIKKALDIIAGVIFLYSINY